MSWLEAAEPECRAHQGDVSLLIEPHTKDLGGFTVRRLLPAVARKSVGPFVFFDHMGPARFAPGHGIDVRPHPHIGLSTLTYVFDGEILHRDSLGSVQAIRPGEVNLMTAGRGIVHSERTPPERRAAGQKLNGIQTWMALPVEREEMDPAFLHYAASALPVIDREGASITLVVGEAWNERSPVVTQSRTLYLDIRLGAGATLALPSFGGELALYIADGAVSVGACAVNAGTMAVIDSAVVVRSSGGTRAIAVGGESLGARHLKWNFVSSSKARIEAASRQWAEDRFPRVPGDDERIPLPA